MSSAILNSNASSALIASTDSVSSAKNPFVYSYSQKGTLDACHVPSHARTVVVSAPANQVAFGQNIDYPVIKSGSLESAFLKFVVTAPANQQCELNFAAMNLMVEEITLLTAGKVICTSKPFGRAAMMSSRPYGVKKNLQDCYGITGNTKIALAGGASHTAYLPLELSCFTAPELNYNTTFCEPLTVRVRLSQGNKYADNKARNGDDSGAATLAAVDLTLTSLELVQVHRQLPSNLEQKQISENFSDTDSLVRIQYDLIEESTTKQPSAAAVSQVFKHEISSNRTVRKMFIALEDTGVASASAIAANNGPGKYLELSKVALKANGQTIFDVDAAMLKSCFLQDVDSANTPFSAGNGWDVANHHTRYIYEWDFGMGRDMSHITNQVSARELSNFSVEVTSSDSAALSARNYNLRVCMVSSQLESISSSSGKISTSLSS